MRVLALAIVALLTVPLVAADHTGDIAFDPAFSLGLVPDQAEIQAIIDSLDGNPWATVVQVGASADGRPLYAAAFTDPDSTVPMAQRVVVFIMTQQHGNEPAGTPAAMRLMEQLRDGGPARQYLDNQLLIILAQSNPDGAMANQRAGSHGEDINRDHVDVGTPEAKAIHEVLKRWDVHMAFDHHEYGGSPTGGIGYPFPRQSYDYDITTMYPNHGNVRAPTADLSTTFNYEHLKPRLEAEGYTHGDYGVTSVMGLNPSRAAGGPDPGILRNSYGLNNVAGLLIESFIPPASDANPFQTFERRVSSHSVVMDEVMKFAHDHAADIIAAKRESERLNLEQPLVGYDEDGSKGRIAPFYSHAQGFEESFAAHGLPMPIHDGERYVSVMTAHRGGLLAAMLHPGSSRALGATESIYAFDVPVGYMEHTEFGYVAPVTAGPAADQQSPGLAVVLLLGALAAIAMLRRR